MNARQRAGYLEQWNGYDLRDSTTKPELPDGLEHPEEHDWLWLEAISAGDKDFPAGFPSSVNEDLRRHGGRWVLTRGYYVADWIETNCVFSDGKWVGQSFLLQPWQVRSLVELFEVHPVHHLRRFRWALIGLPKKNGKSEMAAALSLFLLLGDHEPAPLVCCAAASEEQADLVFGAARTMCEMSPRLKQVTDPKSKLIGVPDSPRARLARVAAAAGTNDGKHIHAVIIDEFHEWAPGKGEQTWNILTNGLGARTQPMVVQITTAGHDEETVCGRQYEHGCRVREGEKDDPTLYFLWYEASTKIEYDTEEAVRSSNPSYGVTVFWPFFEDQLSKKTENVYKRYFLNIWTEAEEVWEAAQLWDDLAGEPELDPARPAYVGIDVGLKRDSTAVVTAQWDPVKMKVQLRQRIWDNPYPPAHPGYASWRLPFGEVEKYLRDLYDEFPEPAREDEDEDLRPGPAFHYDPMFFARSASDLESEGLHMIDYPQSDLRMIAASQKFFELIKQGQVEHDGNPTARRHIRSVIAKETGRGWRIHRPRGTRKAIDFATAAAIAAHEATFDAPDDEAFHIW